MKRVALVILSMALLLGAWAQQQEQRRITPVKPATNTTLPPPKGTDEKTIERFLKGDSLAQDEEARRDSIKRAYYHYPLITDLSLGLNFIDPVLMIFGQDYASVDVNATLNLWNRLQPVLEVGMGWGKSAPEDMNFTYKAKPSPYFKIGANYNFLYKSSPQYQVLLGVRLGYSPFRYDVTDINYNNSYWDEHTSFAITGESSHAVWGELVAGLKVHIWREWSLGWSMRLRSIFNYGKNDHSSPWFVPGYGPRRQSFGFTFTASYTLPMGVRRDARAATDDETVTEE